MIDAHVHRMGKDQQDQKVKDVHVLKVKDRQDQKVKDVHVLKGKDQ